MKILEKDIEFFEDCGPVWVTEVIGVAKDTATLKKAAKEMFPDAVWDEETRTERFWTLRGTEKVETWLRISDVTVFE